jgi:choline dehydrogenase-like flavoprotein
LAPSLLDFSAAPASGAWEEIGFDPYPLGPPPDGVRPVAPPSTKKLRQIAARYDVVVIGSGAGGSIAAHVLASHDASVLVVERGSWVDDDLPRDHIRNHRFFWGGDLDTPLGHPRAVFDDANANEIQVEPDDFRYSHNAIAVGGGTRFFGAQAWRFRPDDFRMASLYGVPEGSALTDWPISYEDLEPFYDLVEWELGVAGRPHVGDGPRQRAYPMDPFPLDPGGVALSAGAGALGWETGPVPLLVNTQPRHGRAACIRCGTCVGFTCPVDARNGTNSTVLLSALRAGADLMVGTQATRINDNGYVEIVQGDHSRTVRAGLIVLAGGAVETARLLELSSLGNDWVGDCLQGHSYAGAFGLFDEDMTDGLGPGPSIATRRFSHDNEGIVGGGMLANDFIKIPALFFVWALPPEVDREGPDARRAMQERFLRTAHVMGPAQEIPVRSQRVRLSERIVDAYGMQVARLQGLQHPEDIRTGQFLAARAQEWLRASGASRTWLMAPRSPMRSGGQHQAGTARMAETPQLGATDPFGKVWGCDRVYVADGSLHVTNGGVNPVLTIMALAWRTADHILSAESGP